MRLRGTANLTTPIAIWVRHERVEPPNKTIELHNPETNTNDKVSFQRCDEVNDWIVALVQRPCSSPRKWRWILGNCSKRYQRCSQGELCHENHHLPWTSVDLSRPKTSRRWIRLGYRGRLYGCKLHLLLSSTQYCRLVVRRRTLSSHGCRHQSTVGHCSKGKCKVESVHDGNQHGW